MFKFLLGAVAVVGLVGYGVVTTDNIEQAGDAVRQGLNTVFEKGAEATREPTALEQAQITVKELTQ